MFKLTFLGTSSGIPTRERNVCGVAVECVTNPHAKRHAWVLVDCGEGTQHQLLKSHHSPHNLSAILITHTHGDHCYGLAGLIASLGMHGRKEPLTLIAPKAIAHLLAVMMQVSESQVNYPLCFLAIEDILHTGHTLALGGGHELNIELCALSHRVDSFGFVLTQIRQKDRLLTDKLAQAGINHVHWRKILKADAPIDIDGVLIDPTAYKIHEQDELKIVIAGDNDTPDLLHQAVQGAKALVHEATYTEEIRQKILAKPAEQGGFDPKHSSASMVAKFAQTHQIPMLVLTHFSARYALFDDLTAKQPNMGHIRAEACEYYQGELVLAEDFLQVVIE